MAPILTPLIAIMIALALISFSCYFWYLKKQIRKNGIETDGVIFEIHRPVSRQETYRSPSYPVVRFVTCNKRWITAESKIGVPMGAYKPGKQVKVVYDESRPERFFIDDTLTRLVPWLMVTFATVLIITGIIYLIRL
ncbi:DUF3592 domain-containing protein [Arachidicoccus terrestris]|uniref:DUF3592 domain-containing protein n=1 Tax=Arachidicoccus terrestris TaxID=2875539 RepID=UPI001CC3AFD5|nr:DUF3592 domain-containing protein [Arachidicoccus terrestris]UAY55747.1 DUF3592 domain-containing protein [Arachidicoccus terrestris]